MTDKIETVVIGAGVIGLAIAKELSEQGREVLVLERNAVFGEETSSRNSEVIHAGIYYKPGSLKAKLCVDGKKQLYHYCETNNIPHKRTEKLIVACSENDTQTLEAIKSNAEANGVDDLSFLTEKEAKSLEPHLECKSALLSPSTGIIDTHQYMLSLVGKIEAAGGQIAYNISIKRIEAQNDDFLIDCGDYSFTCGQIINSAGLQAQAVANLIDGLPSQHIPNRYLAKGSYFTMSAKSPFHRLIYPVPDTASLGVHVTLDLQGQIRFGPDQEWIEEINYDVDPKRAESFYAAIRKYFPALKDNSLIPAYSGIRPKIQGPNDGNMDFTIQDNSVHGIPSLINLFGMESPGLTSSLAIGKYISKILK